MTNLHKAGLLSLGTIFFWALLNVALRYFVLEYNCHPIAIACTNGFFCALVLLMLGTSDISVGKILTNVHTWLFGIAQLLKNICMIYAFVYISSTQANLLTNIEIVLAVLLTWLFLGRRPNAIDFFAIIIITLGCLVIIAGFPQQSMLTATLWVLAASVLTSLRAIFTEIHPENKKTLTVRERCSVTGWILLVSSLLIIVFFALLSGAALLLPKDMVLHSVILSSLPLPSEFIYLPTVLGGLFTGALFYAVSMYAYFYAISLSNNEYFMMYRSTQALFTYGVEYLVAGMTSLPMVYLSLTDWTAAFTIIFCSFSMILLRGRHGYKVLKLLKLR